MFLGNDPSLRWEKSRLQKVDLLIYSFSKYRGHIKYQAVGWGQRVNKMNWSPFPERARCISEDLIHFTVNVVQLLSPVRLFATPWSATQQASLFFTISQSLFKLMTVELVMPSNYLILSPPSTPALSLSGKLQICIHKSPRVVKWTPCIWPSDSS